MLDFAANCELELIVVKTDHPSLYALSPYLLIMSCRASSEI